MKNKLKEAILDSFISKIRVLDTDMNDVQVRRIANALTNDCIDLFIENNEKINELYQQTLLEYEHNRKMYGDDIVYIQDNTKKLLDKMKQDGFVTYTHNAKTGTKTLTSRTAVVNDMVEFLNTLNRRIINFYVNVFKATDQDNIQTKLI